MQALPSAFFHQTSRASRMRAPRGWMAKSTIVVVPPKAAARVPVRKSSAKVIDATGMSRWVWQSMPPGRTYMPVASMTLAAELAGMAARTSLMSSPSMRTSAAMVWVAVTTLPLRIRVFIGVLGVGEMGIQRGGAEKAQSSCHGWARGGMGWETAGLILTRSRGDTEEDAERQKERENLARSQRRFRCQAARRARQSKTGENTMTENHRVPEGFPERSHGEFQFAVEPRGRGGISCAGPLGPGLGRGSGFDFGHGDAIFHRADEPAEIAADALRFVDAGNARGGSGTAGGAQGFGFRHGRHGDGGGRGGFVDVDALVRAVPAGDVAEIAADAGIAID